MSSNIKKGVGKEQMTSKNQKSELTTGSSCRTFCSCCKSTMEEDKRVWESFEKECSEYEYVIENSRVRPVPKKLLEMAQVHQTRMDATTNVRFKAPTKTDVKDDLVQIHNMKNKPTKNEVNLKVTEKEEPPERLTIPVRPQPPRPVFMSQNKTQNPCGPCNPSSPNYNPCQAKYVPEERPCVSCRTGLFPGNCRPLTEEDAHEIINKPLYQKTATPIEILKDIADASVDSLRIRKAFRSEYIPTEIKEVIDTLKVIKPDYVKPHKKSLSLPEDVIIGKTPKLPMVPSTIATTVTDDFKPEDFTGTEFLPAMNPEELIMKCCPARRKKQDSFTETDADEAEEQSGKGRLKWKIVISKHSKFCET